jgi:thioredoxin reductase (NADPH)
MSHYLIDQLRRKSNVATQLRSEIQAVYGDMHLTAVDIHDRTSKEVRRHDCGGLFVFIGADAETQWLPAEIARDARGYVLTGDDLKRAGRWSHVMFGCSDDYHSMGRTAKADACRRR